MKFSTQQIKNVIYFRLLFSSVVSEYAPSYIKEKYYKFFDRIPDNIIVNDDKYQIYIKKWNTNSDDFDNRIFQFVENIVCCSNYPAYLAYIKTVFNDRCPIIDTDMQHTIHKLFIIALNECFEREEFKNFIIMNNRENFFMKNST